VSMAHWSGIGIPKTNAIALEVSYTHTHGFIAPEFEEPVCACFFVWV